MVRSTTIIALRGGGGVMIHYRDISFLCVVLRGERSRRRRRSVVLVEKVIKVLSRCATRHENENSVGSRCNCNLHRAVTVRAKLCSAQFRKVRRYWQKQVGNRDSLTLTRGPGYPPRTTMME